jgi:hypothetical protein
MVETSVQKLLAVGAPRLGLEVVRLAAVAGAENRAAVFGREEPIERQRVGHARSRNLEHAAEAGIGVLEQAVVWPTTQSATGAFSRMARSSRVPSCKRNSVWRRSVTSVKVDQDRAVGQRIAPEFEDAPVRQHALGGEGLVQIDEVLVDGLFHGVGIGSEIAALGEEADQRVEGGGARQLGV